MNQTDHQKRIIEYLENHKEKTFSAKELVLLFSPEIHKATIYRKLAKLEEQKLLQKRYNLEKKCYEYQYSLDCENHFHLICKSCGKIIHLHCEQANLFVSHIGKEHSFLLDQGSTMLLGTCKECSLC